MPWICWICSPYLLKKLSLQWRMRQPGFQGYEGSCFANLSVKMTALLSKKITCFSSILQEWSFLLLTKIMHFFHQSFILKPYSSHQHIFQNSQNVQIHTCTKVSFLIKLRYATLLKNRLWHRCFPVYFAKFLRIPFYRTPLNKFLHNALC